MLHEGFKFLHIHFVFLGEERNQFLERTAKVASYEIFQVKVAIRCFIYDWKVLVGFAIGILSYKSLLFEYSDDC